jgi:hypothetical protein
MKNKKLICLLVIPVLIYLFFGVHLPAKEKKIKSEGPKLVALLEEYKVKNNHYPETIEQLKAEVSYSPRYIYTKEEDQYLLSYTIFVFTRQVYSSRDKTWRTID